MTTLNETMATIAHRLPTGWNLTLARLVKHTPVWTAVAVIDGARVAIETPDAERLVRMAAAAGVGGLVAN